MPVIDIDTVPRETGSTYPEPYASQMGQRCFQALGDAAGLTQFGAVLVTMQPGDLSSLRHWHTDEDEFVWVVSGQLVLVQDDGEVSLSPGDACGFARGDTNGHHLQNRSGEEAQYLAIGTRSSGDICTYSDVDLQFHARAGAGVFTRHDGSPRLAALIPTEEDKT